MSFNCLGSEVTHHFLSQSISQQRKAGGLKGAYGVLPPPYVLIPQPPS